MPDDGFQVFPGNPWFQGLSGRVEFVVFQSRIETLGRWLAHLSTASKDFLESEIAASYIASHPTGKIADDSGFPADAVEWQVAWDDFAWALELTGVFAFGSVVTAAFAATDILMKDLVDLAESAYSSALYRSFKRRPGESDLDKRRRFLQEKAGWPIEEAPCDDLVIQMRRVRNSWAHSLGEDLVISPPTSDRMTTPEIRWTPTLALNALVAVGAFARAVEDGMLLAKSQSHNTGRDQ